MEKTKKNEVKKVSIPKGCCRIGYCCGDCVYMNLGDSNSYGEYYCGKRGHYYPASDNSCNYFVEK